MTNNSLACRSGTVGSGVLGPLTVLEHVSAVTCQGSQCSFVEPAPERFLLATGVEYSPFGGWSLPIRLSVEVTLSQGLVVAENMTVVQTAKAGGTDALATGRIIFGFNHIGSAPPVDHPTGPPDATLPVSTPSPVTATTSTTVPITPPTTFTPPTTAPAGPPMLASAWAIKVAKALVLNGTDLPSAWSSDHQQGECIDSTGNTQVGAISCANQSFPGQQATDDRFARCLGVPVSQVAMLSGNDEPGEPFSYSSSTYTAPGGSEAKINDSPPTAQSLLTIEKSASVQKADLAAFSRASFQACWKVEESGGGLAIVNLLSATFHAAVSVSFSRAQGLPAVAGVRVVGYQVNVAFKSAKASGIFQGLQVIIGDGQIEEVAELGGSGAYPFAPALADQVVLRFEKRLAALVSG